MMTLQQSRPLAPRAKRRRVVLCALGGWLLMLLASVFRQIGVLVGPGYTFVWMLGLGMAFTAYVALMLPHGLGLPMLKDRRLDERQRQQLLQTYTLAYRIVGIVILLAMSYVYLAIEGRLPLPQTHDQWLVVFWTVILLVGATPNMLLAWTEPDWKDEE